MMELNPRISIQVDGGDERAAASAVALTDLLPALAKLDAAVPMRSIRCVRVDGSRPQAWRCEFVAADPARSWTCDLREDKALDAVTLDPALKRVPATADVEGLVCGLLCRMLCAGLPFRILVTYPQANE